MTFDKWRKLRKKKIGGRQIFPCQLFDDDEFRFNGVSFVRVISL